MAGKELVPAMPRPDWLPEGWSVEYRKRRTSNTVDKYYIFPLAGKKLRSKPEVMRFINEGSLDYRVSKRASYPKSRNGGNKPPVQVDHCPSDLPDGWIVEYRLRRNSSRTDSYYIDPIYGHKFRSKKEVSRYLKNQELSRIAYRQKRMHTPDIHLLKEDSVPLIEFIKSKVKRTVARRRLFSREEPISSASIEIKDVDSSQTSVSTLLIDASAHCHVAAVNSEPTCLNPANIEELELRLKHFQIECHESPVGLLQGQSTERSFQMPSNKKMLGPLIAFEGEELDFSKKQGLKRKAGIEYAVSSRSSRHLITDSTDLVLDFDTEKVARKEKARKIDEDYPKSLSVPSDLQEKLEKLELFVEQASNEDHKDIADELLGKLEKLDLSATSNGDLWLDPCIEFAFKTLTDEFLVLEDAAKLQEYFDN